VESVPKVLLLIAWLTAGAGDVSMQVAVERVPKVQLRFAWRTAGVSDVSMQVVATSTSLGKGCVNSTEWRLECGIRICHCGLH
jgi:hypothetical protein